MDDDLFGRRISPHDRYQFEMKLDYKFNEKLLKQKYFIETYFFIPSNFAIHADNYTATDFYKDIQNYIRFKTPVMSFEQLITKDCNISPLCKLRKVLVELGKNPSSKANDKFIYESKLLACIFKSTLRESTAMIRGQINRISDLDDASLILPQIQNLLLQLRERCNMVISIYRSYGQELFSVGISDRVRSIYELIDEFLSLTLESYFHFLLEEVNKISQQDSRIALFEIVRELVLQETKYRTQKGYLSLIDPQDKENELFLYRYGLLKKFSSNILHLDISHKNLSDTWIHILSAVAAGLAMLFATIIGFYAQQYFSNYSISLLFAFVVIYMFKDRIKEIFRNLFSAIIFEKLYDRKIEIYDPYSNLCVGHCQEKFNYLQYKDLPKKIKEIRNIDTLPALQVEERGEFVFHYKRYIELFSKQIFDMHSRIGGLNDIIRFHVQRMLAKMDEPYQIIPFVKEDSTEILDITVSKIYHMNVIFCFTVYSSEKTCHYERLRVVLNQKGIKKVVKIPTL